MLCYVGIMAQKILLVDDDQYIREVYEEVLKDAGFIVDTAADGASALEKIKKGGYDLILLDLVMPKTDGLGVLTALSKNPPLQKNGPIILLTNLAQDQRMQEAIRNGATSYIIKSDITPADLIENVNKFLKPDSIGAKED